jgi:hypothetical protein
MDGKLTEYRKKIDADVLDVVGGMTLFIGERPL